MYHFFDLIGNCPTDPTELPNTPHTSTNQLGAPLPIEVAPSSVEVPFLLQTPLDPRFGGLLRPFWLPRGPGDFPNAAS